MNSTAPAPGVWAESCRIHSYDVDFRRTATAETLCRVLQEAAWNHAEALGVGFGHLADQGRLWVLSRFVLRIWQSPKWNDHITIHTWPRAAKSIFALRDFEILNAQGQKLCAASSAWLVLDSGTRKPLRPDK
jgi:medium-chain acyl-[acyl-carrier-protein] hydrolase